MRPDIDETTLVRLHAIGTRRVTHRNGTITEAIDYTAFKATDRNRKTRYFLSLAPGDTSADWLEITDTAGDFILSPAMS